MRATLLLLPLLAACALPDLDVPEGAAAARSDWPELVPFDDVTGAAAEIPEPEPDLATDLDERAARLRDRAEALAKPGSDRDESQRAARLRQRAEGLR